MKKTKDISELSKALAQFQGKVNNPKNIAVNPFFKSKYAPLDEVLNVTRPILSEFGLSLIQEPYSEGDYVSITTTLLHSSGEWIEFAPLKLKTDKNTAQGVGSAITYARRYAISSILGIASEEDDDGNLAEIKNEKTPPTPAKKPTLSEAQIKRLFAIANSKNVSADEVKEIMIDNFKKDSTSLLTRKEYEDLIKIIEG